MSSPVTSASRLTDDVVSHRVLILDFGSQYTQLIARRVREAGVCGYLVRPLGPWRAVQIGAVGAPRESFRVAPGYGAELRCFLGR